MTPRRWPPPPEAVNSCAPRSARRVTSPTRSVHRCRQRACGSRIHLQCAAFDRAAALEQFGHLDANRFESGVAQLFGEADGGGGKDYVTPIGDGIEAERVRVGAV